MQPRSELANGPFQTQAEVGGSCGFEHDIAALAQHDPELAAEVARVTSVRDVLDWMRLRSLPLESLDVVAQDEFSHDALVPLGDARGRYLSFGMT
jgi:hypothetical protein